jgi:methylated-DNA-[protein]-cysteine S-methyltransferase
MSRLTEKWMETPMGWLVVRGHAQGIVEAQFHDQAPASIPTARADAMVEMAVRELEEYFAGTRIDFSVPLAPEGTPFQHQVWQRLMQIPAGETRTYSGIAHEMGNPGSVRAVGTANGANPIAIIVPCHRVIGADGSLTGYAGGLHRKEWLLAHEARIAPKGQMRLF